MAELTKQSIEDALRNVYDPEIGISIVDLNMIKNIEINGGKVIINLILTMPGCPLAGFIIRNIENTVSQLEGVEEVEVKLLDEKWEPPENQGWQSWLR